jgi:hypothetical protein
MMHRSYKQVHHDSGSAGMCDAVSACQLHPHRLTIAALAAVSAHGKSFSTL